MLKESTGVVFTKDNEYDCLDGNNDDITFVLY